MRSQNWDENAPPKKFFGRCQNCGFELRLEAVTEEEALICASMLHGIKQAEKSAGAKCTQTLIVIAPR